MSDNCVTLVLKTVPYISKLLDFQNFASLVLRLSISATQMYGQTLLILYDRPNGALITSKLKI